jgi:hypothetical protein
MTSLRSRLALPASLLLALVASACDDLTTAPVGEAPTVSVLSSTVVAGSTVSLRLVNQTASSWSYATCPGSFERLSNGVWTDVPTAHVGCLAVLTVIGAGETLDVAAFLLSDAPAGTYRAVVPFATDGTVRTRVSNVFTVEPLPIGDAPTVSVLQAEVARGASIAVRLINPTSIDFLYNLCSSARLERLVSGTWTATPEPLWLCTAALYPLDAGAFADETYPILPDVVPGTYRLRVPLYRQAADLVTRYSNAFVVN